MSRSNLAGDAALETPLAAWESFYVIVGSSAAALTGLQFVVIVLGSEVAALGGHGTTRAFGTPTVVHFCAALLISAVFSAPWPGLFGASVVLGAIGIAGILYGLLVIRHTQQQSGYVPVLEDWIWHGVLPLAAYGNLLPAAFRLSHHSEISMFEIGASVLTLLFVGIHNAWDAVTYLAHRGSSAKRGPADHAKAHRKEMRS